MAKTTESAPTLADDIDELGKLEGEGVPTKYARMGVLRKRIAATVSDKTDTITLRGVLFGAIVGARAWKRTINLPGLFRRLKKDAFLAALRPDAVTLETLESLKLPDAPSLISEDQTGPRSVKTFALLEYRKAA